MESNSGNNHMFDRLEMSVAYADAALHLGGEDGKLLAQNSAFVPIFVNLLYQSVELSLKHAGIESGLFTEQESRSKACRHGHGIKEIAELACERLGGTPFTPVVLALTFQCKGQLTAKVIRAMISSDRLSRTREAYCMRNIGYGQLGEGDFATIQPIHDWVRAVGEVAANLPRAVDILTQWKASKSDSKSFAIWLKDEQGGS